ncbi:hypothetical protein [Allorhizocola rhizosphaerae]|uniref:hypothetical protein n=1 Tax=Allorhizocola rhizosphaerae TaxID=1872709 RepID=UPI0013C30CD8|nr:hypothetical protein [Allorhizocola rhizosphaerae]
MRLNRAVAAAMVHGAQPGWAVLGGVGERLAGSGHRVDAVRAHLLEMVGDTAAAAAHYAAAAARSINLPEQHYLARQAARLRGTGKGIDIPAPGRADG